MEEESEQNTSEGKINLNSASKEELAQIHGIGDAGAEAIVKFREEIGKFSSVDELEQIPGFGNIIERVKDRLTV